MTPLVANAGLDEITVAQAMTLNRGSGADVDGHVPFVMPEAVADEHLNRSAAPATTNTNPSTPVLAEAGLTARDPLQPQARTTLSMTTPVSEEAAWQNEFVDKVTYQVKQDRAWAEIRLNPANLGTIEIAISADEADPRVAIASANQATREIIEQAIPRLRESLAGFDVEVGGEGFAWADGHGESEADEAAGSGHMTRGPGSETDAAEEALSSRTPSPETLVDTFI